MLHDDNWEAHALLGRRAVELTLTIDDLSLRLAQFDQQIRSEGTHTDSSFTNATIRQNDVKKAGQPTHVQEHAIVDYAQVLDQLRAALAALIVELEEPKRTLPSHKLPPWLAACCASSDEPAGAQASCDAAGRLWRPIRALMGHSR